MPALLKAMSTAAVGGLGGGVHGLHVVLAGHVGPHEEATDLVGRRFPGRLVEIGDHDLRALGREPPGGGQPDSAAAAGDYGDPVLQTHVTPRC